MTLSRAEEEALARISQVDQAKLDQIAAEFRGQSDRAAVIVGAAQLDELLVELLARFLLPDRKSKRQGDDDSLLGLGRPLDSFSSRIVLAQRCGLISSVFAESLDIVRGIRNACAHLATPIDLNVDPHRTRIATLKRPIPSPTFWQIMIARFGANTPASQFRAIVSVYAFTLSVDVLNVQQVSHQPLLEANQP